MRVLRKGMVYDHENNKIVGTVYTTEDDIKYRKKLAIIGNYSGFVWALCWPLLSLFACEISLLLGGGVFYSYARFDCYTFLSIL